MTLAIGLTLAVIWGAIAYSAHILHRHFAARERVRRRLGWM